MSEYTVVIDGGVWIVRDSEGSWAMAFDRHENASQCVRMLNAARAAGRREGWASGAEAMRRGAMLKCPTCKGEGSYRNSFGGPYRGPYRCKEPHCLAVRSLPLPPYPEEKP